MAMTPTSTSKSTLSEKSNLKFNCSYGGKIFTDPSKGKLKYYGGETRVFSFPRSVKFSELMEKIKREYNTPFVIKYQLLPEEDLDILVSVKSDEDVRYMIEEYIRQIDLGRFSRFRLYLIPTTTTTAAAATASSRLRHLRHLKTHTEQRYNDLNTGRWRYVNGYYKSSPTSIAAADEGGHSFSFARSPSMQKAHSSPNLHDARCERKGSQFQCLCSKHHRFLHYRLLRNDSHGKKFPNGHPHPCPLPKPM